MPRLCQFFHARNFDLADVKACLQDCFGQQAEVQSRTWLFAMQLTAEVVGVLKNDTGSWHLKLQGCAELLRYFCMAQDRSFPGRACLVDAVIEAMYVQKVILAT